MRVQVLIGSPFEGLLDPVVAGVLVAIQASASQMFDDDAELSLP